MAQEARARVSFERLWVRAAPLLGAVGQPAPALKLTQGADSALPRPAQPMWVGPDKSGRRTIFVTPGQRRLLAKREGNWRSHALTLSLHEIAHIFQSDEVLFDEQLREYGASRWAKVHGPRILGTARERPRFDWWRDHGQSVFSSTDW